MNKCVSLFVLLFALSLSSCKKDVKTIRNDTKEASFVIYTFDEYGSPSGSGSGFFIDSKGTGITNYHVLDGAAKSLWRKQCAKEGHDEKYADEYFSIDDGVPSIWGCRCFDNEFDAIRFFG